MTAREACDLERCEQGAKLGLGLLVALVDGELERFLEHGFGGGFVTGGEEKFPEKDPGHHPVGAGSAAEPVVFDGFGAAAGGVESLGEAEAEKGVAGLLRDERGELSDAVWHVRVRSGLR